MNQRNREIIRRAIAAIYDGIIEIGGEVPKSRDLVWAVFRQAAAIERAAEAMRKEGPQPVRSSWLALTAVDGRRGGGDLSVSLSKQIHAAIEGVSFEQSRQAEDLWSAVVELRDSLHGRNRARDWFVVWHGAREMTDVEMADEVMRRFPTTPLSCSGVSAARNRQISWLCHKLAEVLPTKVRQNMCTESHRIRRRAILSLHRSFVEPETLASKRAA